MAVHNALRSARGSGLELDPEDLEKNFRVNTTALLHLGRGKFTAYSAGSFPKGEVQPATLQLMA